MSAAGSLVKKLSWGRPQNRVDVVVSRAPSPPVRRAAGFPGGQPTTLDDAGIAPKLPGLLREVAEAMAAAEERIHLVEEAAREAVERADQRAAAAEERAYAAEVVASDTQAQLAAMTDALDHLKADAVQKLTAAWRRLQALEEELRTAEETVERVRQAVLPRPPSGT